MRSTSAAGAAHSRTCWWGMTGEPSTGAGCLVWPDHPRGHHPHVVTFSSRDLPALFQSRDSSRPLSFGRPRSPADATPPPWQSVQRALWLLPPGPHLLAPSAVGETRLGLWLPVSFALWPLLRSLIVANRRSFSSATPARSEPRESGGTAFKSARRESGGEPGKPVPGLYDGK